MQIGATAGLTWRRAWRATQALDQLEYPERLQKLLLTPNREMVVELVLQKDNGAQGCVMS